MPSENERLYALVMQLNDVLTRLGSALRGRPLFVVEKVLADELRRSIPDARFSEEDIRRWSAEISS
ncbi:hypothetical protein ACFVWT_01315 [Arthrobacter sp. NPDC058288]|uniref:hypothetical protein n=1 Tax=Arthrobacter sp. NPDC058288 TaxID=3346424 RepID=UPI0036EDA3A6